MKFYIFALIGLFIAFILYGICSGVKEGLENQSNTATSADTTKEKAKEEIEYTRPLFSLIS